MAAATMAVEAGENTLWLNLIAFNRQAEELLRHAKGETLSVSGRLQLHTWEEREQLQVVIDTLVSARSVRPGRRQRQGETPFDDPLNV